MTIMTDPADKPFTLDGPYGDRDEVLCTLTAAYELTERRDLPLVSWKIDACTSPLHGLMELRGHIYQIEEAHKLPALTLWAQEFGAEITEEPDRDYIYAECVFTYEAVRVQIVTALKR